MIKLSVSLFCSIQWKYISFDIIAESKPIALSKIEEEFPLEFRYKPYHSSKIDSLQIEYEEEANVFILT